MIPCAVIAVVDRIQHSSTVRTPQTLPPSSLFSQVKGE
jgi:hypothetical protein